MHPLWTARPPVGLLTALACAVAMAPVLAATGCGGISALAGAPVPASVIGRVAAMARRADAINGDSARRGLQRL